MIQRILPLLNRLLPAGLAFKGLQKMDPKIGKFVTSAATAGYGTDMILDFLRDKFQPEGGKGFEKRLANEMGQNTLRPDEEAAYQQIQNSKLPANIASGIAGLGAGLGALSSRSQVEGEPLESGQEEIQQAPQGNLIAQFSPELNAFLESEIQKGRSPIEAGAIAQSQESFRKIISQLEKKLKAPFSQILSSVFGQGQQNAGNTQGASKPPGQGQQALMQILQQINQRLGS